jgi:hypothetical protein
MNFNRVFFIGVSIVVLSVVIYYFATAQSRLIAVNEVVAMSRLQSILNEENNRQVGVKKYIPLNELGKSDGSIPQPGQVVNGYRFDVRIKGDGERFEAIAVPAEYNKTGRQSFYVDESGKIRAADKGGAESTSNDPELF